MTHRPSVRPADRNGLENVEKKSAMAVTSISSTRMRPTARSMPGSVAGAAHDARTSGDTLARHVGQHRVERHDHHHDVDDQRQPQAAVLAEDELGAAERLGEQAVDAAPLHLLPHQADADEDRDHQPEGGDGRQPEVLDDLDVLPGGELAEQVRRRHQQHRERDQVVEHLVAHRLAEHADGDGGDGSRARSSQPPIVLRRGHLAHEEVLERVAQRVQRHELGAGRGELGQQLLGRAPTSGSSSA